MHYSYKRSIGFYNHGEGPYEGSLAQYVPYDNCVRLALCLNK